MYLRTANTSVSCNVMKKRIHKRIDDLNNDIINSKRIYKYHKVNKFLYDLLINNELWFADPFSFNDPFDSNITIDGNNTPEQIKNYYKIANWEKSKNSDAEIQKLIESNFQDRDAFKRKINSISKKVIGSLGLACFTETNDNLLMWAHYTEEHKGAVLEFNHKEDSAFFKPLKKVIYVKKYPVYNYYDDKKNVVEQIMLHKSDDWVYEKEIRLLKHKTGSEKFNPKALTGIYFGVKTTELQINTIKNLIAENKKYQHVNLFKATLDETDYKINFKKL